MQEKVYNEAPNGSDVPCLVCTNPPASKALGEVSSCNGFRLMPSAKALAAAKEKSC